MEDPKEIFKRYCRKHDMRYTPEREMIINEIYRKYEHFDIDTLFLGIRNRNPDAKLAKGSIYRMLPHLISSGLIRTSFTEKGHTCYERTVGHKHHDHMKCIGCGEVYDFSSNEIEKIQDRISKRLKFKIVWQMHVLNGYCSKCQ